MKDTTMKDWINSSLPIDGQVTEAIELVPTVAVGQSGFRYVPRARYSGDRFIDCRTGEAIAVQSWRPLGWWRRIEETMLAWLPR